MKINYEQIIEKANARKLALERMSALLDQAEETDLKLAGVIAWVDEIRAVYGVLDDEGRKMLPLHIQTSLAWMSSISEKLSNARSNGNHGVWFLTQKEI